VRLAAPLPYLALRGLRLGCVQYLNSRPLIHPFTGPVLFDHPSALAKKLSAGELDAALVPVFEALRNPQYFLVDGAAVASDGPVFSVFLAYRGELRNIRRVALDPASLTSAHLLRILLAEYHGLRPEFGSAGDAQLLIGNQAIEFRLSAGAADWNILDLGEEWQRCTGLPFVFAVWALRSSIPDAPGAARDLRALKAAGLAQLETIIAEDKLATPEFRRQYLTSHIQFDIGERGRAAVTLYRELLAKHGFIASPAAPLQWV
jgi:chorismate dehydratase